MSIEESKTLRCIMRIEDTQSSRQRYYYLYKHYKQFATKKGQNVQLDIYISVVNIINLMRLAMIENIDVVRWFAWIRGVQYMQIAITSYRNVVWFLFVPRNISGWRIN